MGNITAYSFIIRLYSATDPTVLMYGKNISTMRSKTPSAFTRFISNLIHQRIWFFSEHFMQGISITILTPKDNNNLFISYYIKSFHRLPPPLGSKLTLSPLHKGGNYKGGNYKRCKRYPSLFLAPKDNKVNPLAHTKAETTRITFL